MINRVLATDSEAENRAADSTCWCANEMEIISWSAWVSHGVIDFV